MSEPGSVLHRSFSMIRRNFPTLLAAAAWPYMLLALCCMTAGVTYRLNYPMREPADPVVLWKTMGAWHKLVVVLVFFVWEAVPNGLAIGSVAALVAKDVQTGTAKLADAFSSIGQVLWRLLFLSFCIVVICQFASFFFVVPGVILLLLSSFAVPVIVIEQTGVWTAVRRSFSLVPARFGSILSLYVVLFAVVVWTAILFSIFASKFAVFEGPWWTNMLVFWFSFIVVASILVTTLGTVLVQTYWDIRIERGELATATAA